MEASSEGNICSLIASVFSGEKKGNRKSKFEISDLHLKLKAASANKM